MKHYGLVLINLFVNLLNYEKKDERKKRRLENLKFTIIIFVNSHLPTCDHFNLSTIPKISSEVVIKKEFTRLIIIKIQND